MVHKLRQVKTSFAGEQHNEKISREREMRIMSFHETTNQIRGKSKDVTRQVGWAFLKPGEKLQAVIEVRDLEKVTKYSRSFR